MLTAGTETGTDSCEFLTFLPDTLWCPVLEVLSVSCDSFVRPLPFAQENNCQSFTCHGSGACVTESMSVMTDPATYGIINSELTNCARTAAVLGELAAQWQQVMGTLQRVEQETVSSQNMVNAGNPSKIRSEPEELVGHHTAWRACTRGRCMAGIR